MMEKCYGQELIIDLHECDVSKFNREDIGIFLKEMCLLIEMTPHDLHFWDDIDVPEAEHQTDPKTKGTSAIQFLMESNITIHTLDLLGRVYVNIFSCKDFNVVKASDFTKDFFSGKLKQSYIVRRL